MKRSEEILNFWFGTLESDGDFPEQQEKVWFKKSEATDQILREKFERDLQSAIRRELDDWTSTPRGRLALIILLDQFSRNIYRGTPQSFAQDKQALELCLQGIEHNVDRKLRPIERLFFYLPMEHAEDVEIQRQCVKAIKALSEDVVPSLKQKFIGYIDYAVQHCEIIERFGRFPHRNKILARGSTEEELEFLEKPGSSF